MRQWQERLRPEHWRALELHRRLASRVVRDLKLAPLVFDIARLELTSREAQELLELLDVIHEARCPASVADLTPGED